MNGCEIAEDAENADEQGHISAGGDENLVLDSTGQGEMEKEARQEETIGDREGKVSANNGHADSVKSKDDGSSADSGKTDTDDWEHQEIETEETLVEDDYRRTITLENSDDIAIESYAMGRDETGGAETADQELAEGMNLMEDDDGMGQVRGENMKVCLADGLTVDVISSGAARRWILCMYLWAMAVVFLGFCDGGMVL